MSRVDFYAITAAVRPRDLLKVLGWRPAFQGRDWIYGPCPVCQRNRRREATLSVSKATHGWHCHRCRKGGGVLQLSMHLTGLPIYPAALALCEQMAMRVPLICTSGYRRKSRAAGNRETAPCKSNSP